MCPAFCQDFNVLDMSHKNIMGKKYREKGGGISSVAFTDFKNMRSKVAIIRGA